MRQYRKRRRTVEYTQWYLCVGGYGFDKSVLRCFANRITLVRYHRMGTRRIGEWTKEEQAWDVRPPTIEEMLGVSDDDLS